MDTNKFFDSIAKVVDRFAEELAEQRLQEKVSRTGRGPKVEFEKTEKGDGAATCRIVVPGNQL